MGLGNGPDRLPVDDSDPDTALRLARYFGTTDRFWLNLQTRYDLEVEKDHLGASLDAIRPLQSA